MLTVAIRYADQGLYAPYVNGRNQPKVAGFQVRPLSYHVLKTLIPDKIQAIPCSRIVDYRYITANRDLLVQSFHFLVPVTQAQLPQVEAITKQQSGIRGLYLWRDSQWWSFPQLETYTDGEMTTYTVTTTEYGSLLNPDPNPQKRVETRQIEKTKIRVRETYQPTQGPGFLLAETTPNQDCDTNPAGFPVWMMGNGMVLEWKRGYADKSPCWWLRDEKQVSKAQSATYHHYATLKATYRARWSRGFNAWYYSGGENPPQSWLALVGYQANHPAMSPELAQQIEVQLDRDQQAEATNERLARIRHEIAAEREARQAVMEAMKPYHQFQAMLKFSQAYTETLHHLSRYPLLPALATPPLDDPWS